jgi:hypothetical protein
MAVPFFETLQVVDYSEDDFTPERDLKEHPVC